MGAGGEDGEGGDRSVLAGCGHPLHADSSSHMAAAGRQDSWWEQDKQGEKRLRFLIRVSGRSTETGPTACLAANAGDGGSLNVSKISRKVIAPRLA